ncbi:splicing factor 3B subunit 3-like protein [Tanacetum coccineum]|uniref:Splicing factor 3B subunit 3-like protein n=1 Tax=Tanacetum coccineum TaxID=301880 RepID=A0ABQ5CG40_9ASTR
MHSSLQEKVEQVTKFSRATFIALETSLNDKSPFDVAPILIDFLVKSCTVTYSIVGVDCGWDNPVFAALELDYSERDQGKHLTFYELDLGLNNVYRKSSQLVDDGANMLVAVPGGGDGPSGVLVYTENFVIYKNQDPGHPDVCAVIPRRADLPAERGVLIVSATMHKRHKSMFFFLLQTEYGDVFKVTLDHNNDRVTELKIKYFDTIPTSSALCVMKSDGFLFAASEFGNHALYQFQAIGTNPDVESSSTTSMETDDGLQPVRLALLLLDTLPRTCLSKLSVSQLPGVQTAFWTVKKNINDEFDAYIVVSFANATLVLSIGGETVKEVSDSGLFLGTTPSLGVSMIGDDSLIQVHPTGIRHIREDGRIDKWRTPGKQTIVKVGYNRFQVVITLSGIFLLCRNHGLIPKCHVNNLSDWSTCSPSKTIHVMRPYHLVNVLLGIFPSCAKGCKLFGYREDSNEAAFVVAAVEKIFAHESLTFNDTVACEVIFKWKAGLKDDMDARSDVYALSNGCRKCSDGYYWEYTPGSLKANLQHMDALSITKAGYMTFTEVWKKKIWLKGLLAESGYELSLVAVISTSALVKGGSWSEVPAQKPTGIACAITGTFSSSGSQELVVARGKLLELLRLDKHDYIVVDSDYGLVSILAYNEHDNVFNIIHRETIGKSGCRRIVPGHRDSAANLTISSPLETHKSCTVTYSIVGVDCGWDNPVFAALELDYSEPHQGKHLRFYELDLGLNNVYRKLSQRVDDGANMLVAVPGGGDGPSGVLVCAENFVIYKNQDPGHPDVCAVIPRRLILPSECGRVLIVSATLHIHKSMFFFLLQTKNVDVFKVTLDHDNEHVTDLKIKYLDTISTASAMCVRVMKSDRFLFAASEFGNYALYQFQAIGKILNGSHHPFTSDGNDDGFNPVLFKPKVCEKIFLEFDQMESFDAHFGNDRPGLAISELALSQLPGVPEMQSSGQFKKHILMEFVPYNCNDSLMQVHPTGIRHIREDGCIDEWITPGKETIVKLWHQVLISLWPNWEAGASSSSQMEVDEDSAARKTVHRGHH